MEFETKLDNFHNDNVYGHHFIVPEDVVEHFFEKNKKRFTCTINDKYQFPCAFMPRKGLHFVHINSEIRKKFRLQIGTTIHVKIEPDDSKYGMPMPEELGELLKIDDEASEYFHALTKGKQRNLIYLVAKPKGTDTRLKKAIVITEHLKRQRGKVDFKILNQDFKAYNQR